MKKIVSRSIVALVSTVIFLSSAASQELAVNINKEEKAFSATEAKDASGEVCSVSDVSKKVIKSFQRLFGDKPNAVWMKTKEGFVVRFKGDNRTTNAYFSINGAIDGQVDYYFEDALPKDVRHTVRSNFYDYSIKHVSEVRKNDFVCYFVKIEDKAFVKTVQVIGDEYSVVETLTKR